MKITKIHKTIKNYQKKFNYFINKINRKIQKI